MKKIILMIAALALVSAGSSAFAFGGKEQCKHKRMGGEEKMQRMQTMLDLSEQQVSQIREIRAARREQRQEEFPKQERVQLNDLDPTSSEYQLAIAERAREKAARVEARMIDKGQTHAEIFAVLTPEQQEKLKAYRQERRSFKRNKMAEKPTDI